MRTPKGSYDGVYTRESGARRTYHYHVSWILSGLHLLWDATVRWRAQDKGAINGILSGPSTDPIPAIRAEIEPAIEALRGIEE